MACAGLAQRRICGWALNGFGQAGRRSPDAMAFMQEATKDPKVLVERFKLALALLKQQPQLARWRARGRAGVAKATSTK